MYGPVLYIIYKVEHSSPERDACKTELFALIIFWLIA